MFRINRKIEYALIAIKHLNSAPKGHPVSVKEICRSHKIPFDPASRVLQIMAQHGIVQSEQGAHGGYRITANLSKITFLKLSEIIEGPIGIVNCTNGNHARCKLSTRCSIVTSMANLNNRMTQLFNSITLRELIETKNSRNKFRKIKQRKT